MLTRQKRFLSASVLKFMSQQVCSVVHIKYYKAFLMSYFQFFKEKNPQCFVFWEKNIFQQLWFLLQSIEQRFLAELIFTSQEFWYTMLLITNCDPSSVRCAKVLFAWHNALILLWLEQCKFLAICQATLILISLFVLLVNMPSSEYHDRSWIEVFERSD